MTEFEKLLGELELLAKADKPDADDAKDDDTIKDAADGDRDDDGEPDGEDALDDYDDHQEPDGDEMPEDDEPPEDEHPLKKSLFMEDGTEVEAYDGTALVKSLMSSLSGHRADTAKQLHAAAQAMTESARLIKSLQDDVRRLNARVNTLSSEGRGRKSVINVHEKPSATPAQPGKITPAELMAKALDAQRSGKLTSADVAQLEVYIGRGLEAPASLIAKIA